jgi:hypothetical protein
MTGNMEVLGEKPGPGHFIHNKTHIDQPATEPRPPYEEASD